jgi:hypothetical protein
MLSAGERDRRPVTILMPFAPGVPRRVGFEVLAASAELTDNPHGSG